jgi:hypothetical protein
MVESEIDISPLGVNCSFRRNTLETLEMNDDRRLGVAKAARDAAVHANAVIAHAEARIRSYRVKRFA